MILPKCGLTTLQTKTRSRLEMEETETNNTKVSDSAYSTSCNSKSQRSSNSSNSQHSNSSASSGYCGHLPQANISNENQTQSHSSKYKDKEQKKTKNLTKLSTVTSVEVAETVLPLATEVTTSISSVDARKQNDDGNNISTINSTSENDVLLGVQGGKKKMMSGLDDIPDSNESESENTVSVTNRVEEQKIECSTVQQSWPPNEGKFCIVVSLVNGFVMYTSASLKEVLGFPNDMWLGRSFIDFVHPKDRASLSNFITSSITTSGEDSFKDADSCTFFCRLRRYHSLKSVGFGVTEKSVSYLPFQLNLNFREAVENDPCDLNKDDKPSCGILLLVTAALVTSAYKHPDETCASPMFTIRHLASGKISYVDSEAVQHLGYLPQDMIDCSVFDFYHPEDLPFVKETYETLIEKCEPSFRSKPYRFSVQNGGYVLLETEWSSFINPWSRKLELIISRSRVLKGPSNPDVFSTSSEEDNSNISEEVLKESKVIQKEIQQLLHNVYPAATEISKLELSKRCKDLTTFVENLISENSKSDLKIDVPPEEHSFSEHDSVMLGEISPHHDYCDSKSSSETPPSYNQLNYHENIHRFFESKPKTTASDESIEMKVDANHSLSTDEEGKCIPVSDCSLDSGNQKCCSPVIGSRLSSESLAVISCDMPHLTEALLTRHNEDMEKQMVQKHREQRSKGEKEGKCKECRQKNLNDKAQDVHGLKRSGSHSWEGEPFKTSKYNHNGHNTCHPCNNNKSNTPVENCPGDKHQGGVPPTNKDIQTTPLPNDPSNNYNLWLPFSVNGTQNTEIDMSTQQRNFPFPNIQNSSGPQVRNMIPVYYIPSGSQFGMPSPGRVTPQGQPQSINTSGMIPAHHIPAQGPYAPSMMYHPMQPVYAAPPPHMMCQSPIAMLLPATLFPTGNVQPQAAPPATENKQQTETVSETAPSVNGHAFQRPASLATSVKAEPGSIMGSIASASVKRGMSESSRNEPADSQDGRSIESFDDFDKSKTRLCDPAPDECIGDETSNSFYSSLKTETSDESTKNPENATSDNTWEKAVSDPLPTAKLRPVLKGPPWLNDVSVTSDLIFKYRMSSRQIMDVLEADKQTLMKTHQPVLVNEQLSQLYADMEVNLGNMASKMDLEESLPSSSSSGEDHQFSNHPFTQPSVKTIKKKKIREYSKLVMIFEENAPLPPPIVISSS